MKEKYVVIFINGHIGQRNSIVTEAMDSEEAKLKAKSLRSTLTKGERSYYRETYRAVPLSKVRRFIRDYVIPSKTSIQG